MNFNEDEYDLFFFLKKSTTWGIHRIYICVFFLWVPQDTPLYMAKFRGLQHGVP